MVSVNIHPAGQYDERDSSFRQQRRNALIGFVMIVIAVLFLLYMGTSLVHDTQTFWHSY